MNDKVNLAASGKAVAWECRVVLRDGTFGEWHKCTREQYDSIRLTGHYNGPGGALCECRALYLHPATVTDEDVERTAFAMFSADSGRPNSWEKATQREHAFYRRMARLALESFANKERE